MNTDLLDVSDDMTDCSIVIDKVPIISDSLFSPYPMGNSNVTRNDTNNSINNIVDHIIEQNKEQLAISTADTTKSDIVSPKNQILIYTLSDDIASSLTESDRDIENGSNLDSASVLCESSPSICQRSPILPYQSPSLSLICISNNTPKQYHKQVDCLTSSEINQIDEKKRVARRSATCDFDNTYSQIFESTIADLACTSTDSSNLDATSMIAENDGTGTSANASSSGDSCYYDRSSSSGDGCVFDNGVSLDDHADDSLDTSTSSPQEQQPPKNGGHNRNSSWSKVKDYLNAKEWRYSLMHGKKRSARQERMKTL
jgi:hypothetical protein